MSGFTKIIAYDTETDPIGPFNVIPNIVCLTYVKLEANANGVWFRVEEGLIANADGDVLRQICEEIFSLGHLVVAHSGCFDACVVAKRFPDMVPKIFAKHAAGEMRDTKLREKELNLSTIGMVDDLFLPDGTLSKIKYDLVELEKKYLGIDRSEQKKGEDVWRLNYVLLINTLSKDFPPDARQYAMDDSVNAASIYFAQESQISPMPGASTVATQVLQTCADFALNLISATGIRVDEIARMQLKVWLDDQLHPSRLQKLLQSGVLDPGEPPRTKKGGGLTQGKNPSIKTKILAEHIEQVCRNAGIAPLKTSPSDRNPEGNISRKFEFVDEIAAYDTTGILKEYCHRAAITKLSTTELPRMGELGIVWPCFDVMKKTSRTSSFASNLYPSIGIQNVDPRARGCYIAREGWALYSCDYSYVELVSLAQKCYSLFGRSALRELINSGKDPHEYLGAQIAYHLDSNFRQLCVQRGSTDGLSIHAEFSALQTVDDDSVKAFFAHYRKFAKPTGLGYPGGLGPDTFVTYAKDTFGVTVDVSTAAMLREIYRATFPEVMEYHNWVKSSCHDPNHQDAFGYFSPLGLYRANCIFTEAANGCALQTPTGEGFKLAIWEIVRACFDHTRNSILFGTHVLGPIHDEILGEIPIDDLMHERAMEVERVMCAAMQTIMPDVRVRASLSLMLRWDKNAKPVYGSDGRIQIWKPKETAIAAVA